MKLRCMIFDPTHNITALVTTPVPRKDHARAASELIQRMPDVEQVGFLENPTDPSALLRLQMMGGEFCGNAAMSAAAYLAQRSGLARGETANYPLEVSGAEKILCCQIKNTGDGFQGTVPMPLPESITQIKLFLKKAGKMHEAPAVRFPGIIHCIIPAEQMSRKQAELEIRPRFAELCASLHTGACGLLLFDAENFSFSPLVYVASTNTAVWESGCGSGSAAIGAYLAGQSGSAQSVALHQPGGTIRVQAETDGHSVTSLTITGYVRLIQNEWVEISS